MRNQITRREFAAAAVGATALTLGANLNCVAKAIIGRYGLGWFANKHAGHETIEHAGSGPGFVAWMAFIPKERLGFVILSNLLQTGINYALRSWILDPYWNGLIATGAASR